MSHSLPYCFDTGSLTRPVDGPVVSKSQIFSSSPYNVCITGSHTVMPSF